jgi:uncharacterized membrane protein
MADAPRPRRKFYQTLEAKSLRSRSLATIIADSLTTKSSSPLFLFLNALFFAGWIAINTNLVPGINAFDPFPFGLLTMFVSLEAIFLSIFVLVSQNRAAQIATLREELHLRINLISEQETTKCLEMLFKIHKHLGMSTDDPELQTMLKQIDPNDLEESINDQLERANQSLFKQLVKDLGGTGKSPKKEEKSS